MDLALWIEWIVKAIIMIVVLLTGFGGSNTCFQKCSDVGVETHRLTSLPAFFPR